MHIFLEEEEGSLVDVPGQTLRSSEDSVCTMDGRETSRAGTKQHQQHYYLFPAPSSATTAEERLR